MTAALVLVLVAAVLFAAPPARAWEAKAAKVAERLRVRRSPGDAHQRRKPGWARKIRAPEDKVSWTESHRGRTYVFGVGLIRGVDNPALRAALAEDRARASIAGPGAASVLLERTEILDWYLDRQGGMHALAVLER